MRSTITTAAIPPELMPFLVIGGTASRASDASRDCSLAAGKGVSVVA